MRVRLRRSPNPEKKFRITFDDGGSKRLISVVGGIRILLSIKMFRVCVDTLPGMDEWVKHGQKVG